MNKLILVNGDIATGKSHFAILIRDRFHLPLFTKDEFKESLVDTHPYSNYEESHKLSILSMEMLINSFKETAKNSLDLILEANFHEEHLKIIERIANEHHYLILHFNLIGSPDILYKRYIYRRDNEKRHPVHAVNSLNEYEPFKEYVLSRRNERLIGRVITINTDSFDYQKDESVFKIIEEFLNS